jgi:hypothetical protein
MDKIRERMTTETEDPTTKNITTHAPDEEEVLRAYLREREGLARAARIEAEAGKDIPVTDGGLPSGSPIPPDVQTGQVQLPGGQGQPPSQPPSQSPVATPSVPVAPVEYQEAKQHLDLAIKTFGPNPTRWSDATLAEHKTAINLFVAYAVQHKDELSEDEIKLVRLLLARTKPGR